MLNPQLVGNTPELSDAERDRLFGYLTQDDQSQVAYLFWECETPEQRGLLYTELRAWWQAATVGVN